MVEHNCINEKYKLNELNEILSKCEEQLTGMWQVSGRSDITDFDEVVKLDLQYIDNWNIGLDIKILLHTVAAVLFGKGAK